MADEDVKLLGKVVVLDNWKYQLAHNRAIAEARIDVTIKRMRESGIFQTSDLTRYRSQMLNGVATPEDFNGGMICQNSVAAA